MGDPADLFEQMAERIRRNAGAEFAGAVLLVPPKGEPVEVLLIDPAQDVEHFWVTAEAKVRDAQARHLQTTQGPVPLFGAGRR